MKLKNIIIILALFAAITGCEKQLDLAPISAVGDNGYYTNGAEVEGGVIAIYDGLQQVPLREFALTEMRSDNSKSKSREGDWAQFEAFTVASTNQAVSQYWAANYNVIFRSNVVLENLEAVETASDKAQFEGEALFTRALAHFNLVRAFGDVPLVDKVIIQSDEDYFSRKPVADVLAFIDADLTAAAALLPATNDYGRASATAASALLGKVKLTTGDYPGAKVVLEPLLNGTSELIDSYSDVFYQEGNKEVIFAIPYLDDDANESQDFSYEMTALGAVSGLNYITDDFKSFLSADDTIRTPVLVNQLNTNEVGKFLTSSADNRRCGNDWIVLRHADVLLMYAEAILGKADVTADGDAINAYNAVRARAGQSQLVVGTDDLTRQLLSDERRVELAFENHRFYDLIRFGLANTVIANHAAATGQSFEPTDLLLPIPQIEINVSAGKLTQNPGYN